MSTSPNETARCTGHCCVAFNLYGSPDELVAAHAAKPVLDGDVIIDMLVYLGQSTTWPTDGRPATNGEPQHFYTCRHHDRVTGDCGIYDSRPRMCSDYPYGRSCCIPGCTSRDDDLVQITRQGETS